ncbi:hypothetical protein [Amycolatopsis sp. NPDC051071]|uniref:hypothetical protein n=1 Tax=Amycolatopsis sp. NPDC051071 TaxID=3154637 RepID=UPI003449FF97
MAPRHRWRDGVIRRALQNGDTVTRDEVYEIGKYNQARTLRGITRPVTRIVSRMRAKGVVPASAVDLLKPIYEGVQAIGFSVPTELVNLAG